MYSTIEWRSSGRGPKPAPQSPGSKLCGVQLLSSELRGETAVRKDCARDSES